MASSLAVAAFRLLPKPVGMFLVRLFTPKYTLGVQVLVRRPDGRILLVDQPYRSLPTLPGGTLTRGESVLDAARRELREETGLDAALILVGIPQVRPRASWVTFYALVDVDERTAGLAHAVGAEISSVRWADPRDLPPVDAGVDEALRHAAVLPSVLDADVSSRSHRAALAPVTRTGRGWRA